ncbi:hypothetical protein ABIE26_002095 [Pedobacter africanus]|uniref:Uncharacterized protein n=1 Tax=Pedobacter africanus TaxID=151894 RepID=A0ACC6KZC3_9SPHI|nr:zinc-dependent metalloprotease [Pedobacter africanus]MDR6784517.1 hypothetical protein [Pedobacter africanus]
MTKYIFFIVLAGLLASNGSHAQLPAKTDKAVTTPTVESAPADEPKPFDKFFKPAMKVTPGVFPVYQDGNKYFLELSAALLNSDVLILGDVARGYASNISRSSGVVRFSLGSGNVLNVTRAVYKEASSPDFNGGIEELVQKSNLEPVSFVVPIIALGKTKGSYLVDITKQLMDGGDFFSFKEVSSLSSPDPSRSSVQKVTAAGDAVVFSVLRTQTVPGQSVNGSKPIDRAMAYVLNLVIQRLPSRPMPVREADARIGFNNVNYNDFGKSPYGVRNVKVITKWNLEPKSADYKKYASGKLVDPLKPIQVFIDPATPTVFVPYLKKAVEQWNVAFRAAGFSNALVIASGNQENWLSYGKILINWGNASRGTVTNTVVDPRTGEILAGKINIDVNVSDELLASYFAKCGFKDPRIMKDLYNPEVRGEIMEWKVAQGLGELLGMVPNLRGSAAYTISQLRSGSWLNAHSISASVTDDTQFNFVVQPEDQVETRNLMPRVSVYDKMAIGWGYRIFSDRLAEKKATGALKINNAELLFLDENNSDPFTRKGDLSNDHLAASELGMKNIQRYYPQLEQLTAAMAGGDEEWKKFKLIAKAYQISYQLYTDNVLSYIGGKSVRPVLRNYNEQGTVYTPKADQKKAMLLLNTWLFEGAPDWMQSKRMNLLNEESETIKMGKSAQDALRKFITPELLNNLIQAEYALGKAAYTVSDLFDDIDHYIFRDFNTTEPVNDTRMLLQMNFIYDLTAAVKKNDITAGLSESSQVLHLYFIRTMKQLGELAAKHQDAAAREKYQMIKQKIERDFGQKVS